MEDQYHPEFRLWYPWFCQRQVLAKTWSTHVWRQELDRRIHFWANFVIYIEDITLKIWFETKNDKSILKNFISEKFRKQFIFLLVFYPIICLMKNKKNFGKIFTLKIWELISLEGVKTHFRKLALKWSIFRTLK